MAFFEVTSERMAVPKAKQGPTKAMREADDFIIQVANSKGTGKIRPDGGESVRSLKVRLWQAAKRVSDASGEEHTVKSWDDKEFVYFNVDKGSAGAKGTANGSPAATGTAATTAAAKS